MRYAPHRQCGEAGGVHGARATHLLRPLLWESENTRLVGIPLTSTGAPSATTPVAAIVWTGVFFFLFELSYEVIYDLRDAPGDIATGFIPVVGVAKAVNSADNYVKNKDELRALDEGALDPYIAEREAYEQNRHYKIEQAREAMGMESDDGSDLADGPMPIADSQ